VRGKAIRVRTDNRSILQQLLKKRGKITPREAWLRRWTKQLVAEGAVVAVQWVSRNHNKEADALLRKWKRAVNVKVAKRDDFNLGQSHLLTSREIKAVIERRQGIEKRSNLEAAAGNGGEGAQFFLKHGGGAPSPFLTANSGIGREREAAYHCLLLNRPFPAEWGVWAGKTCVCGHAGKPSEHVFECMALSGLRGNLVVGSIRMHPTAAANFAVKIRNLVMEGYGLTNQNTKSGEVARREVMRQGE
jgi:hypothetical protein